MAKIQKKLLFVSTGNSASGPHGEICLSALSRNGWDITVVAPGAENSLLNRLLPYKAKFHDLPKHGMGQERALARLLLGARLSPSSVLYLHSQSLSLRAWLWLLGPTFGKRIVYHNPDYYDPFDYPGHYFAEKQLSRKSALCLNNEFHRAYLTRAEYRLRCPVVTVPIMLPARWPFPKPDPAVRNEICGGAEDAFVLILHGGYGEIRMVPELFKALSLLPKRFRLVMFDRDHRKAEVDRKLSELNIADRVVRYPRMNISELARYTVNADAGVLLYQNNDLGNFFTAPGRLTEYVGAGLPVIATNHTGLENLVWRYKLGLTADSTQPAKLAEEIANLAEMVRQKQFQSDVLRQTFLDKLAFDHWEPEIVQHFENLLLPQKPVALPPKFPWLAKP